MATHKKKTTHTRVTKKHEHQTHSTKAAPKKTRPANDNVKNIAIIILAIALVAVLYWAFRGDSLNTNTNTGGTTTQGGAVAAAGGVEVSEEIQAQMTKMSEGDPFIGAEDAPIVMVEYSEYLCPYCKRFKDDTLGKIKENFIDTGVVKFVYKDFIVHGESAQKVSEAAECARDQDMFWEYHDKIFENQGSAGQITNLKKWAVDLGLDATTFNTCLDSGKHAAEIKEDSAEGRAAGVTGTPGFIINGQLLSGAQPYDAFEDLLCAQAPESEPCKNRVPPKEVKVTILNDKNCGAACSTTQIEGVTRSYFRGAVFKKVDASSSEGQALIEEHNLKYAPAYLFEETVTETDSWKTNTDLQNAFVKINDGYRLADAAVGATWPLDEEEREAMQALMDNYPEENLKLLGASGDKPRLDYFVMSFCPYGNPADEATAKVQALLGDAVKIVPHYIIDLKADGTMSSLHGVPEGNQGVRELCALDLFGYDTFYAFTLKANDNCNSQNVESCWEGAAEQAGMSADQIAQVQSCFESDWKTITQEQGELNSALKSYDARSGSLRAPLASPTFLINGETHSGGRDAESLKNALCALFDGDAPSECSTVLNTVTAAPQGNC